MRCVGVWRACWGLAICAAGCGQSVVVENSSSSTAGPSTTTGGTGGETGAAGGTGGAGAAGGTGGAAGSTGCVPGAMEACYEGPSGTEGLGVCAAGAHVCQEDGSWAPCLGQALPHCEDCATSDDETCDGIGECTGALRWVVQCTGSAEDHGFDVAIDGAGNAVVVGSTKGPVDCGAGPLPNTGGEDGIVLAVAPYGKVLWSRTFGSPENDALRAVAVDAEGNIYVAGDGGAVDFGGGPLPQAGKADVQVAKLDPAGNLIWAKAFGGPLEDWLTDLAVGPDGDIVITGGYLSTAVFDGVALPEDVSDFWDNLFVVKLSALDGVVVWAKGYGDAGQQLGRAVGIDETGTVVVGGLLGTGTIDFGGGPLTTPGAGNDIVVAGLSGADASHLWSHQYGDSGVQDPTQVRPALGGGFMVSAQSTGFGGVCPGNGPGDGKLDVLLWKVGLDGETAWAFCMKTLGTQYAEGLAIDPLGNLVLSGAFSGTVDFGDGSAPVQAQMFDRYVAKLSPDGSLWWQRGFPGTSYDHSVVATDSLGRIVLAGDLTGTTDFGSGPVTSTGNWPDIIVVGLRP